MLVGTGEEGSETTAGIIPWQQMHRCHRRWH